MPPALVFRSGTGVVEEIALKGVPLGGPGNYPIQKETIGLERGDTVFMMTDGFPERFNAGGEMLGYERAVKWFAEAAARSPQDMLNHLADRSEQWAGGRRPDDDMTFVVLKMKD